MGRPSKYRESYCQQLVEHMQQGLSFESFAAVVGVHRDTLYEWVSKHEAFSDAKKRGWAAGLLYFEQMGIQGMIGGLAKFNPTVWIFTMKCRFKGAGWLDKPETKPQAEPFAYNPALQMSDHELIQAIKKVVSR
jgi:hypothetical protein